MSGASVYNYYRDYSPETGRYIESDPIGLRGGPNTYTYVMSSPIKYSDRTGLITECELFALQLIINRYGVGPKVNAGGIITDPTLTRGPGNNPLGGPIVLNTNPTQSDAYSGSVTAKGQSGALVQTGLHENVHQGQGPIEHTVEAIREWWTNGNVSNAQTTAENLLFQYPQMVGEFQKLVEDCRKCRTSDPEVK